MLDRARAAASARFASSCAGAELFDVDRCTVTKAIGEIKPLLTARGFAAPTGFRLTGSPLAMR